MELVFFYLLLLLLVKPAAQAKVGKTKLFINCFRNPTSTCATENWTKHHSGKHRTVDCTLESIQRSSVKHSVGKVITQSNLSRRKDLANLDVLHLDTSNSNRWTAAAARVCRTLVEADGSSLNRQWLEFELTLYNIKPSHTTSMTQQETRIGTKPGHRIHLALKKLKVTFSSWPTLRRTILKDWENIYKITTK